MKGVHDRYLVFCFSPLAAMHFQIYTLDFAQISAAIQNVMNSQVCCNCWELDVEAHRVRGAGVVSPKSAQAAAVLGAAKVWSLSVQMKHCCRSSSLLCPLQCN
eukprot:4726206-Amphidinium_carterae.1